MFSLVRDQTLDFHLGDNKTGKKSCKLALKVTGWIFWTLASNKPYVHLTTTQNPSSKMLNTNQNALAAA